MRWAWICHACIILGVYLVSVGCSGDPTVAPNPPVNSTVSSIPGTLSALPTSTVAPAGSPTSEPVPATTPAPPSGAVVVAATGVLTTEITALPQFVTRALYDSLITVNPSDGSLAPGLAERWTVSDDAKVFTFTLRSGVKWHDGTPLAADDVVFTVKALSDPDIRITPGADFGPLEDARAVDDRTVRVTLSEPYCAALTSIGILPILPAHRLEGKPLTSVPPTDLIGTGPLILEQWNESSVTFKANAAYWNGAPRVASWTYSVYATESAARAAVSGGQADVTWLDTPTGGGPEFVRPVNEFYALALNNGHPPFDDLRARQAVASALDRAEITRAGGAGAVGLETSVLPSFWAYPSGLAQASLDRARARTRLTQAGWRDTDGDGIVDKAGKPFEVTLWAQADEPRAETSAELVQAQLAEIGIRAILKLNDRLLLLTRIFLQEYDLAIVHLNIPLDPDQHYFWASSETEPGYGLNVTAFTDARVDNALQVGNRAAQCAPGARKTAFAPVFEQLASETPMVFLFAPAHSAQTSARLSGPAPSPFAGPFWNLNQWQVQP